MYRDFEDNGKILDSVRFTKVSWGGCLRGFLDQVVLQLSLIEYGAVIQVNTGRQRHKTV